jgi:Domain of unknown function (DUF4824)
MRKLMIVAVVLLVLTNVVVLAGVAYNRSGEPVFSLELTERELSVVQSYRDIDENSGTALTINWHNLDSDADLDNEYSRYGALLWLNEAKLAELGFDVAGLKNTKNSRQFNLDDSRADVILVIEFQGEGYTQAIEIAESRLQYLSRKNNELTQEELDEKIKWHKDKLNDLKISETRLYVIDAGINKQFLLQKYADKNNIFLAHGEVSVYLDDKKLTGHVRELYIPQVHVPLPYSDQLAELTKGRAYSDYGKTVIPPRYQLRLNVGKRLEPWIESITAIK